MVGTPCRAVHFSRSIASRTLPAWKYSSGTMVVPWVTEASVPGRGRNMEQRHGMISFFIGREIHAVADRFAVVDDVVMREHDAFGKPVVPEVYCMLMTRACRGCGRSRDCSAGIAAPRRAAPARSSSRLLAGEIDDIFQKRQALGRQLAGLAMASSGRSRG